MNELLTMSMLFMGVAIGSLNSYSGIEHLWGWIIPMSIAIVFWILGEIELRRQRR